MPAGLFTVGMMDIVKGKGDRLDVFYQWHLR